MGISGIERGGRKNESSRAREREKGRRKKERLRSVILKIHVSMFPPRCLTNAFLVTRIFFFLHKRNNE